MTLSEHIDETRPKTAWRVGAGVFVVGVAIAAFATLDGSLFGLDLSDPLKRVLLCAGVGLVPGVLGWLQARRG